MILTKEQEEIINSDKLSFKINAVAGSGKTTTLLEYAKRNSHLKILYLAYNKSLQTSLQEKLKEYNLPFMHISTIHSLAYNKIEAYNLGAGKGYSVLQLVEAFEKANGVKIPYVISERRAGDVATCYADSSKAKEQLGWEAEKTIEDMCKDSWNWQSKNPNGYKE